MGFSEVTSKRMINELEMLARKEEIKNIGKLPKKWLAVYLWAGVKVSVFIMCILLTSYHLFFSLHPGNTVVVAVYFIVSIVSLLFVLFMWCKTMNEYNQWYIEIDDIEKWFAEKYKKQIDIFLYGIMMIFPLTMFTAILHDMSNFSVFFLCAGFLLFFIDFLKMVKKRLT